VVTAVGPNFATRHNPRTTMTSPPDLHQRPARTLIAAMKESAAPAWLIAVSTANMGPADTVMGTGPRLLFRFFRTGVAPNLGRVGKDLQAMEEELAASGLDWYALRPVKLTDGPLTGHVQASDRFTMKTISPRRRRMADPRPSGETRPHPSARPGHHHRRQQEVPPSQNRRPRRPASPHRQVVISKRAEAEPRKRREPPFMIPVTAAGLPGRGVRDSAGPGDGEYLNVGARTR